MGVRPVRHTRQESLIFTCTAAPPTQDKTMPLRSTSHRRQVTLAIRRKLKAYVQRAHPRNPLARQSVHLRQAQVGSRRLAEPLCDVRVLRACARQLAGLPERKEQHHGPGAGGRQPGRELGAWPLQSLVGRWGAEPGPAGVSSFSQEREARNVQSRLSCSPACLNPRIRPPQEWA